MNLYKPMYCIHCKTELQSGNLNSTMAKFCPKCQIFYSIIPANRVDDGIREIKFTKWTTNIISGMRERKGGIFDE